MADTHPSDEIDFTMNLLAVSRDAENHILQLISAPRQSLFDSKSLVLYRACAQADERQTL
jgi:hypothetical protein